MRKRAQRKTPLVETTQIAKRDKPEKKKITFKKNWWIAVSLVAIFFIVLFLNSYFNIISDVAINPEGDSLNTKFYLSGPDPYYNMRLVEETVKTGRYPFYTYGELDPLLNYPVGRSGGGRAPLLNMLAIGFSRVLTPFMSEMDALGYSMQFVPALFGALLVLPVYFIGKILFGRKEGLVGALLVAIVPIHIGSGHGSAYGLFDHDSFNLLLFLLTFLFLIKSVKDKNPKRSILYALLSGVSLAALYMVWVEGSFLFVVIAGYAVVQILFDIFNNKMNSSVVRNLTIILFTGYFVSLPVLWSRFGGFAPDLPLLLGIGVALFGLVYIVLDRKKIPWIVSLPAIFCVGGIAAAALYFINNLVSLFSFLSPLRKISEILYGSGIYGNKVDLTIAEAGTYGISRSVMSYGPALYWLAWAGLVFLIYYYFKQKGRRDYLFIITVFIINIWLAGTAGRFLNDMVPLIAILAGWIIWFVVAKVDYKQMLRNIRNAGGGLRGFRRGIKIYHALGIFFVSLLVILPNAFLALDAAVPSAVTKNGTSNMKIDYFGEDHSSAFGSSSYKEQYWIDAYAWLKNQDVDIEDPAKRPAFISWWDYGFYEVAVGEHPTVADNFQDGIPPAANFHTAKSEKEAVAVMIVRLLEGNRRDNNGELSTEVVHAIQKNIGENDTNDIVTWIENPTTSPSYNTPIGEEYDEELSKDLFVGEQWVENAVYHDITERLNNTLDDDGITWLYHDIQEATGYSIRYYGVEGYDRDIFNIFAFLGDKSLVLHALRSGVGTQFPNPEDDFVQVKWAGYYINPDGSQGQDGEWTAEELNEMSKEDRDRIAITDTPSVNKPDYFKTMFYRTYIGNIPEELQNQISQLPCWGMKHFSAEYISEYPYYGSGRSAVVIAKYYEGAKINGSLEFRGDPLQGQVIVQKDISIYGTSFPIDHDLTDTENGTFSLIAPAGNITLQIRRNTELGANAFVMKTITFNSTTDLDLAPITEDEAMRTEGTNYERVVNITIDPADIEGYVYQNNDNNDDYNTSSDEPLANAKISLIEMEEFDPETGQPSQFGSFNELTTDEMGYYNTSDLKPGIYLIQAILDDFVIHENYLFIYSGNNSYNISKPKPASVKGTIYFDENENNEFNIGEEMNNVDVEILYPKVDGDKKHVDSITTDETGTYSFSSLIPGNYFINASKTNTTTGYLDYTIEEEVTLTENETTTFNVSIRYAPIVVSGYTEHEDQVIEDIFITFNPDESVANNTAQRVSATSEEDGQYIAELMPGYYNVSVDVSAEQGTFSFEDQLHLKLGEGKKSYDISLTKHSFTTTGSTTYDGTKIGNITIRFSTDTAVENNTAVFAQTTSDENGSYIVELLPGSYNVTVDELVNESGQDVTYTFTGPLEIQAATLFDIALAREESL
ncbi:MAG: glycosyltransferase family 39 protein [Thermoplasmatales archaeon]|nr:MAG: glycosyltransferase family 39 protein [Thermoplasmatales archaeon]